MTKREKEVNDMIDKAADNLMKANLLITIVPLMGIYTATAAQRAAARPDLNKDEKMKLINENIKLSAEELKKVLPTAADTIDKFIELFLKVYYNKG